MTEPRPLASRPRPLSMPPRLLLASALLLLLVMSPAAAMNFGDPFAPPKPLYDANDPGVVSLTADTLRDPGAGGVGGAEAWLVEFYSSWCGHCVHFAPDFKKLAADVQEWKRVIKVGAIDCAQEENMVACREHDVMGYPTLKFFPPHAPRKYLGEHRESHDKTPAAIKKGMLDYVDRVAANITDPVLKARWPILRPFTGNELDELWPTPGDTRQTAYVFWAPLAEEAAREAMLDCTALAEAPLLRRATPENATASVNFGRAGEAMTIFRVDKTKMQPSGLAESGAIKSRQDFVREFRRDLAKSGAGAQQHEDAPAPKPSADSAEKRHHGEHHAVVSESEVKRRRYTAHVADAERAMLYSLAHEAAQRGSITGSALVALQDYLRALSAHLPARRATAAFLTELEEWVSEHDDAVRGEDLGEKIQELKFLTSALGDLPEEWVGCKGAEKQYGGYPCGLWTLFHILTVNQAMTSRSKPSGGDPASSVLLACSGFVREFFGCRECARHFALMAGGDGDAEIRKEVRTPRDAVLWLWRAHNRVNLRLSGDITDDPSFPKGKFPNPAHCSDCYVSGAGGSDLWSEFRIDKVYHFLEELYGRDALSMAGLADGGGHTGGLEQRRPESHDLVVVDQGAKEVDRAVDKENYQRKNNEATTIWPFMSSSDRWLAILVYGLVLALLAAACLKFGFKKGCRSAVSQCGGVCLFLLEQLGSSQNKKKNPLLGKV